MTREEVEQAVKTLQNAKAAIEDESVAEILKNEGKVMIDWLRYCKSAQDIRGLKTYIPNEMSPAHVNGLEETGELYTK